MNIYSKFSPLSLSEKRTNKKRETIKRKKNVAELRTEFQSSYVEERLQ
jgi:hypothetical protein